MESRIARELKLRFSPVAIIFTNQKPEGSLRFKPGTWGCSIAMLSAASKGQTAAFSREALGCQGGAIGLGLRDTWQGIPGGIEHFLSTGRGEGYPEGEGYRKTPELAHSFTEALPTRDIPYEYVVFKPLDQVNEEVDFPQLVVFLANADQLSALVTLANYGRPGLTNVVLPAGAGCHSICILPLAEAEREMPRAVIGLTDISARPSVAPDLLSFTVPLSMFREMEDNVPGSFLDKESWKKVRERIPDPS